MISVIMLTYNRENFVSRAIESILGQTYRDFEFIIVDNGSTDRGGQIADAYAAKDNRVRVIHRERGNIGAGRNTGLDAVRGEYITFVDDDDYAEPGLLEHLYDLAVSRGADIAVCGSWREAEGARQPKYYGNIRYFSEIKGDCKLKVKIADTALEPGDEEKFYSLFGDISDAVAVEHIFDLHVPFGKVYDAAWLVETDKTRYGHALRDVKTCWIPFIRMVIHPDGVVEPCCVMKIQSPKNLREVPLPEQWNCDAVTRLRKSILQHDLSAYPPCQTCHIPIQNYHPEDILDGHEEEILSRMRDSGLLGG